VGDDWNFVMRQVHLHKTLCRTLMISPVLDVVVA